MNAEASRCLRLRLRRRVAALLMASLVACGCNRPWYAPEEKMAAARYAHGAEEESAEPLIRVGSNAHARRNSAAAPADPFDLSDEQFDEGAMAEIAADLQALKEVDPEVQQQLLADLRDVDPVYWPQMVRQFRATLAYRRQQDLQETPIHDQAQQKQTQQEQARLAGFADVQEADHVDHDVAIAFHTQSDAAPHDDEDSRRADTVGERRSLPEPETDEIALAFAAAPHEAFEEPRDRARPQEADVVNAIFDQPVEQLAEREPSDPDTDFMPPTERPNAALATWKQQLDHAIGQLEQETASAPSTSAEIGKHARLRLMQVAAGNDSAALEPIEGVPPSHQDFWSKLLFGLSTYLNEPAQPDVRRRASLARLHLDSATDLLGEIATLDVRNLTFCSSLRGFGNYDPIEQPQFRAGEQVKLYAEVANYRSEQTEEGFRTHLATSYEVLDASDRRVDSGEFPHVEDLCRSRRRDFHIQYGVNLPTRIYPGTYRLQLTIEDMLSRKLGRASVEFEIVDGTVKK